MKSNQILEHPGGHLKLLKSISAVLRIPFHYDAYLDPGHQRFFKLIFITNEKCSTYFSLVSLKCYAQTL